MSSKLRIFVCVLFVALEVVVQCNCDYSVIDIHDLKTVTDEREDFFIYAYWTEKLFNGAASLVAALENEILIKKFKMSLGEVMRDRSLRKRLFSTPITFFVVAGGHGGNNVLTAYNLVRKGYTHVTVIYVLDEKAAATRQRFETSGQLDSAYMANNPYYKLESFHACNEGLARIIASKRPRTVQILEFRSTDQINFPSHLLIKGIKQLKTEKDLSPYFTGAEIICEALRGATVGADPTPNMVAAIDALAKFVTVNGKDKTVISTVVPSGMTNEGEFHHKVIKDGFKPNYIFTPEWNCPAVNSPLLDGVQIILGILPGTSAATLEYNQAPFIGKLILSWLHGRIIFDNTTVRQRDGATMRSPTVKEVWAVATMRQQGDMYTMIPMKTKEITVS